MSEPIKNSLAEQKRTRQAKQTYAAPELKVFGRVKDITKGPNTAPADAQGTGGLFGAGGTS